MAKLYFRYGVMGSSKTANALMVRYNYEERGQDALLVKPAVDQRDGARFVASRAGLSHDCIYFSDLMEMTPRQLKPYACIIVDEAQFLTREEVRYLTDLVDDWNIPVICYGLRADFKGDLFPGSAELLATADIIEEVKTICWCGKKAVCNARFDESGHVLKEARADTSSRRGSRWCWGPTTSTSACAASTGRRATWGPRPRGEAAPAPGTPPPADTPAAGPPRRHTARGPAWGCFAAPPATDRGGAGPQNSRRAVRWQVTWGYLLTSFRSLLSQHY